MTARYALVDLVVLHRDRRFLIHEVQRGDVLEVTDADVGLLRLLDGTRDEIHLPTERRARVVTRLTVRSPSR